MRKALTCVCLALVGLLSLSAAVLQVSAQSTGESKDAVSVAGMSLTEIEGAYSHPDSVAVVHRIPNYPVQVDGVRYEPQAINRFDGQVLRFVWDQKTAAEGVIYAFTTVEGLERYLREQWDWSPAADSSFLTDSTLASGPEAVDPYTTQFFEHDYYGGSSIGLSPSYCYDDLASWPAGWNDRISSLKVATGASWGVLWEHAWRGGDAYYHQSGTERPYLWDMGWNDRASSVCALR